MEKMKDLQKEIVQFKKQTGYTLEVKDNHLCYSGSLDLEGCTDITSLPEGLTVGGSLDLEEYREHVKEPRHERVSFIYQVVPDEK